VVVSNAYGSPPIEAAQFCASAKWPFAILTHSTLPLWWPSGEVADRARRVLPLAKRCFFLSKANLSLLENQLGFVFDNAEIVRNPILIQAKAPFPWPIATYDHELRMACVGRLSPEKGQDILIEALANPSWRKRKWHLTFFGVGQTRDALVRLVSKHNLQDRISFAGYVEVVKIWYENHILAAPSHFEGAPLAIIEAMFCGRPVVATSVGINPEIIKEGVTGFLAEAAVVECFGRALERRWAQRQRLQEIGKFGAAFIREFIPDDPVEIFAEKLMNLTQPPACT
jgi:glycosyltransferase involved in cell wall biosynthesis